MMGGLQVAGSVAVAPMLQGAKFTGQIPRGRFVTLSARKMLS